MTDVQRRKAAAKFAAEWKDRGSETGESQPFWLALLRDVFAVECPESYIKFNYPVRLDNMSHADALILETRVLIEHKSLDIDLSKKTKQSDGAILTPFEQAKRYADWLPARTESPYWIIVCNFSEFWIYDLDKPRDEPIKISLENLADEYHHLKFLVDTKTTEIKRETKISLQAGEIVDKLYNEIKLQYKDPNSPETLRSLNMLCVRLVFCLYAEDAKVFRKSQFHDYLKGIADKDVHDIRSALRDLFKVLSQDKNRDPYLKPVLTAFPYVNGGLFDGEDIEIPHFNEKIVDLLLNNASKNFDWSEISPTIFGAVFEGTLNPDVKRKDGAHFTYIEDIHKVIDPLFLDELKSEFEKINAWGRANERTVRLRNFQLKLASLTFLDPACGSGNFLTETYISLRRLENQVLRLLHDDGQMTIYNSIIKVSIEQFYGIEINDFAIKVAKTALWISESQMMKETEDIFSIELDFLPLKQYKNIAQKDALNIAWEKIVSKERLSYIMGNPPFRGKKEQTKEQKNDLIKIFDNQKGIGKIDYVSAWYKKSAQYIENTTIQCAFVSTNSITQGEQVSIMWKSLLGKIKINFAHRSFEWSGEAAVHCVVIGFSVPLTKNQCTLYENGVKHNASNINPYLVNAPDILVSERKKPLCCVPHMVYGSMSIDKEDKRNAPNALILSPNEVDELLKSEPNSEKFIREYIGGDELIKGNKRYCLWLKDFNPHEFMTSKFIKERVERCHLFRKESNRSQTKALADKPHLFGEIRQPELQDPNNTKMLVVPKVSSKNRKYIPMDFVSREIIVNGSALIIPEAINYHFGILTSSIHMAWMRAVGGRTKSDYQYSSSIVYNSFPWVEASERQKTEIEKLAKAVLEARQFYAGSTLANMYDEYSMPFHTELVKAHKVLDKAVMKLYGFTMGASEAEVVAGLMERYRELAE